MSYIGHFYNNKGYVVSLYRSPGQTSDEFYSFVNNLEKLMTDIYSQKADFVLIIGDFNAKSCNWSINDPAIPKGAHLESITSLCRMNNLFQNQLTFCNSCLTV